MEQTKAQRYAELVEANGGDRNQALRKWLWFRGLEEGVLVLGEDPELVSSILEPLLLFET
jgi:hypothetical protein